MHDMNAKKRRRVEKSGRLVIARILAPPLPLIFGRFRGTEDASKSGESGYGLILDLG